MMIETKQAVARIEAMSNEPGELAKILAAVTVALGGMTQGNAVCHRAAQRADELLVAGVIDDAASEMRKAEEDCVIAERELVA